MGYKVAVLMGGQSFEREFSLNSGKNVCEILTAAGHEVVPLDTTSDLVDTLRAEKPDVAYVALHGKHGEDGTIQSLLEVLGIPYVGCTPHVCRRTRNKANVVCVLDAYRAHGDGTGPASWFPQVCMSLDAFKEMGAAGTLEQIAGRFSGYPLVVKPACGGSAMGLHKVKCFDELAPAILDAFSYDDEVIVGEWVEGVEVGVSVIEDEDGNAKVLPPVEIAPKHEYFDTSARLDSDEVEFFAPPREESLSRDGADAAEVLKAIEDAALEIFESFRCRDVARVDMIWDGEHANVIEVDVSPGMSRSSLLPAACAAAGIDLGDFLTQLLDRAVARG
ncbi:MAG: D-alanine--D-alanine ligase family protein [Coriobacteriales bacterium]|jgi:D-alanine-D-alanine ligase